MGEDSLDFTLPLADFSVTPFIYDIFPLPQDTPSDGFENLFHHEPNCSTVTVAFQKIVGRWDPDLQNHRAAEEGNISLKPAPYAADTSSVYTRFPLSHQSVSLNTRDDLLAAILKNCEPHNVTKVASAFPSPQIIEQLLLRFLDSHSLLEDTWIHVPTFKVDDAPPELLLSCIASSAMDSSNNNFRRFGKALHSVLHPHLFQVVRATSFYLLFCDQLITLCQQSVRETYHPYSRIATYPGSCALYRNGPVEWGQANDGNIRSHCWICTSSKFPHIPRR